MSTSYHLNFAYVIHPLHKKLPNLEPGSQPPHRRGTPHLAWHSDPCYVILTRNKMTVFHQEKKQLGLFATIQIQIKMFEKTNHRDWEVQWAGSCLGDTSSTNPKDLSLFVR